MVVQARVVVVGESKKQDRQILEEVNFACERCKMRINKKKTKTMIIGGKVKVMTLS